MTSRACAFSAATAPKYVRARSIFPDLILELRRRIAVEKGQPLAQKAIFSVVNNRRLFHSMLRAASCDAEAAAERMDFIRHLPIFPFGHDGVPQSARHRRSAAARHDSRRFSSLTCKEKVAFYAGCLIDFAYPEMGESVVKYHEQGRHRGAVFPKARPVAARPPAIVEPMKSPRRMRRTTSTPCWTNDVTYVVSACPTCTVALKHDFISTFESLGQTDALPRARQLADKVIDFSSLVKKLVEEGRLKFKEGQQLGKITYHDSCHLKRTLHASQEPRRTADASRL